MDKSFFFHTRRYGYRPIPSEIDTAELLKLRTTLVGMKNDVHLMDKWLVCFFFFLQFTLSFQKKCCAPKVSKGWEQNSTWVCSPSYYNSPQVRQSTENVYQLWWLTTLKQDLCNKVCPDHWALIIEVKDDLHWNCLLFAKRHFLNKRQPKLQARDSGIWWAQNENMKKYFDISGGGPWERCSWCCERRQRHFMRWGRCFETLT